MRLRLGVPGLYVGAQVAKWTKDAQVESSCSNGAVSWLFTTAFVHCHTGQKSQHWLHQSSIPSGVCKFETMFHNGKSSAELEKICKCFFEEEYDNDGILIYSPPPLDDVWLSEPHCCECHIKLEQQRERNPTFNVKMMPGSNVVWRNLANCCLI